MIKRKNDKHVITYFKKKVSTAFINGAVCSIDSSGFLIPATATSVNHVGVIMTAVTSADSDYATATYVPVDIGHTTDLWIADVSAGSVAQTVVGDYFDFNSTGDKVDLSASTVHQVFVVDILPSTSQVVIQISSLASADESGT
mgnify:CR=1 FL=1